MTPEQFARLERLFEEALAQPADRRAEWVRTYAADDPAVLRKLEGMLAEDASASDTFEAPVLGSGFHVANVDAMERRWRDDFARAGRFRLLALLGEGGFGRVYRAEQLRPVRREVAIKVIKPGMDTRRVLARFEAERQTLAIMNHPGIAKFLDAGATESGRSYFVMELVEGRPISAFCDEEGLDLRGRLELFVQVCEAVHHAHQRGVLHRDLKPTNVLVLRRDGRLAPVVIDFGIARALDEQGPAGTLITEQGLLMGTPEYMSPEQAGGEPDIDTRTDIYSLGVMLYELLTGSTPLFRSVETGTSPAELQRLIRETDPPTPSSRLRSTRSKVRQNGTPDRDPAIARREVHGDLDWIVMKAIEKDRTRRYETADAFAADLRRFMQHEAVTARPPTAAYRFCKFARRNRAALAAGSAMFVLLVAGVIGTALGMLRAQREAETARAQSAVARSVSDFLNHDLLTAIADQSQPRDVRMKDLLDVASERVEGRFADQPAVELAIRCSLARSYRYLGEFDAAERHLLRAVTLRKLAASAAPKYAIEALFDLADLRNSQGRSEEAESLQRQALAEGQALEGESGWFPLLIMNSLAQTYRRLGRPADAEALYQDVIAARRAMGEDEENQKELLTAMSNLATLYYHEDRSDEAKALMLEVLARAEKVLGPGDAVILKTTYDLAGLLRRQGQLAEAEARLEPLARIMRETMGAAHPHTYMVVRELALLWEDQQRFGEALELWTELAGIAEGTFGRHSPMHLDAVHKAAGLCDQLDRPSDAAMWRAKLPAAEVAPQVRPAVGIQDASPKGAK